jgi:hypothetical protein
MLHFLNCGIASAILRKPQIWNLSIQPVFAASQDNCLKMQQANNQGFVFLKLRDCFRDWQFGNFAYHVRDFH